MVSSFVNRMQPEDTKLPMVEGTNDLNKLEIALIAKRDALIADLEMAREQLSHRTCSYAR